MQTNPDFTPIPLSPTFAKSLSSIIGALSHSHNMAQAALVEAHDQLLALRDFLDHEIAKADLAMRKREIDQEDFADQFVWWQLLCKLRDDFTAEGLETSTEFICRLIDRLHTLFVMEKDDLPQE